MGFLLRCIFWLSLVLLLVPFGGSGDGDEETVSPIKALSAAGQAMRDMAGLCERQPDVCETGRAAIRTIGVRARESARIASELLGEDEPDDPDAPIATGSVETDQ